MTAIEWTDETWNPVVGCSRVSPGCDHCYAISTVHRGLAPQHRGLTVHAERTDWTGEVRLVPERLVVPLRWRKPRRVFVNSLSDLFHATVPDSWMADVFAVMATCQEHTFQVLTKRPQIAQKVLSTDVFEDLVDGRMGDYTHAGLDRWPLPNVWLGTSIESDAYTFRADLLRNTPAAVRFLSCEPLLGPLPSLNLDGIDWVIVGGESGPGARPMHPEWVRDLRDRCADAGVAFFFKQWGSWAPLDDWRHPIATHAIRSDSGHVVEIAPMGERTFAPSYWSAIVNVGKKAAGRILDGRTWDEMPPTERLVVELTGTNE